MYLRNIIIYKHLFNISIVRIKVARSTIGYSEVLHQIVRTILIFLIIVPWPVFKIEAVVQEQLQGHPLHQGLGPAVDLVELRGHQQLHQRGLLHPGPVVFRLTLRIICEDVERHTIFNVEWRSSRFLCDVEQHCCCIFYYDVLERRSSIFCNI